LGLRSVDAVLVLRRRIKSPRGSRLREVTMRNRNLWIGLGLVVLLVVVVTAVVLPRYLGGLPSGTGCAVLCADTGFLRWLQHL
jgi:hypothetical protein